MVRVSIGVRFHNSCITSGPAHYLVEIKGKLIAGSKFKVVVILSLTSMTVLGFEGLGLKRGGCLRLANHLLLRAITAQILVAEMLSGTIQVHKTGVLHQIFVLEQMLLSLLPVTTASSIS
jgi:hypothetical protein